MRRYLTPALSFLLCLGLVIITAAPVLTQKPVTGATATGSGGVVASPNRYATQAGIDILKAGGNAIDAAVATAAALGVVEPYEAGIGGGGFMMVYLKAENRVVTIDGRETAPLSASPNLFQDPDGPAGKPLPFLPRITSGAAVGVPGTLLTWTEALNRYGTLSLEQALKPSISLAEKGFTVNPTFARFTEKNKARFAAFTSTSSLYLKAGQVPQVGSKFTNPDLAKTYRLVAQKGPNEFYRGEIAKAIVATVQRPPTVKQPPFRVIPGGMTMTDLDYYDVEVRSPVTANYRGYNVYGMGLPSSGGITGIQALNLAEGYDLTKMDRAKALHTILESDRLAYADRSAYLGDPEFVDVPTAGLLSQAYTQERRVLIGERAPDDKQAIRPPGNPLKYQQDPSPSRTTASPIAAKAVDHESLTTAHLTTADRFGNVVAYTLTIEQLGGSGIVVPGYGFLLNNELTDFNLEGANPNSPEPGKRPLSSMSPTVVFAPDGRVMAFGSPGGSTIITTVLGITFNLIDFNMTLDQAIAAPRLSQRNSPITQVDSGLEKTPIGKELTTLGHVLRPTPEIGAATGVVVYPDGRVLGTAEPTRRGGGSAMVVKPSAFK